MIRIVLYFFVVRSIDICHSKLFAKGSLAPKDAVSCGIKCSISCTDQSTQLSPIINTNYSAIYTYHAPIYDPII